MQRGRISELQRNILKTLVYADIFDYPLNSEELCRFLISDDPVSFSIVSEALSRINTNCKRIDTNSGLYFLKGKEKIVELRKERTEWAKEKWEIARKAADKLKIIPFIKMIGVTGALAMENCKEEDDIDLLIITSSNSLWLARLLVIILCNLMGIKRRKPNEKNVKNKICLNLFLDKDHLKIKPENLFLAHEICQVKPIYDKGGVYEKFIQENEWTKKYLPNAIDNSKVKSQKSKLQVKSQNFSFFIMRCLNEFFYKLQFWYMKPKMTIEKVGLHQAFFHPKDLNDKILKEFERRILKFCFFSVFRVNYKYGNKYKNCNNS